MAASMTKIAGSLVSGLGADFAQIESVTVRVYVDRSCPTYLAQAVRQALVPERVSAHVEVLSLAASEAQTSTVPDAAIIVSGGNLLVGEKCAELAASGIPVAVIVESAVEAPRVAVSAEAALRINILAGTSSEAVLERLAVWLASATEKGVSCAASFPFCREALVSSLVSRCAATNAAIGAVSMIPGSDMALMTSSQIRLALDIATAYGLDSRIDRIPELAGVACAGLAYRSAARSLVGVVPGFGWLLKASMGYFGTKVTARGIVMRIEHIKKEENQPQVVD